MANIIVVVDKNRDSILCGYLWWGGRSLYVAELYMAELICVTNRAMWLYILLIT